MPSLKVTHDSGETNHYDLNQGSTITIADGAAQATFAFAGVSDIKLDKKTTAPALAEAETAAAEETT